MFHKFPEVPYSKIIDVFIEWKTGANGGRGNKELGDGAKTEWKTIAGYLKGAIGGYSSKTGKKTLEMRLSGKLIREEIKTTAQTRENLGLRNTNTAFLNARRLLVTGR